MLQIEVPSSITNAIPYKAMRVLRYDIDSALLANAASNMNMTLS